MQEKYPTAKVIILYGIYGSIIAGLICGGFITVITFGFGIVFALPLIGAVAGVSFLPALTVGIILALRKEMYDEKNRSSWILGTGFLVTAFYTFAYTIFENYISSKPNSWLVTIFIAFLGAMASGMLGGLASIYTSKKVLPHHQKENEK